MVPSDDESSHLINSRHPRVPRLILPSPNDNSTRSLPVTTNSPSTSPRFFTPNWSPTTTPYNQTHFRYTNLSPIPRRLSPSSNESSPLQQRVTSHDSLHTFNLVQNKRRNTTNEFSTTTNTSFNNTTPSNDPSVLAMFDPLQQSNESSTSLTKFDQTIVNNLNVIPSTINTPPSPTSSAISSSFPYPIKLRLKLTACSEIKPFSQLVQNIRNEYQSKQISKNEIFYCKRVQRLTSQHIEQNQSPVTLYIFIENLKEPICLTKISLQSTVAHILDKLLELISFDYEQSILKLRSYEEYLRNEDSLCDIEYVYNCINSLKQLQFVLVKKPISIYEQKKDDINFEQFCLKQQEKYFPIIKQLKSFQPTKSSNKNKKQSLDQNHSFIFANSQWLEEFLQNINQIFEQIEKCFNNLINPNICQLLLNEQIKLIEEFINYIKIIQNICSDIQSSLVLNKQRELKNYIVQLKKIVQNNNEEIVSIEIYENLTRLLWNLLYAFIKYIQAYCQAFLIPYQMEIYNSENQLINIEKLKTMLIKTIPKPCQIIESSELFCVHIDSLFSLPLNVKTVRIVANLCYGNKIIAKQMTRLMSFVRNTYQENTSQVRFDQRLFFDNAHLCELQRESLILFEIYAGLNDETDSSLISEVFDGISMRLIGWCTQTLFDNEHRLITGEYYLGVYDALTANRTGFYSLRNVFNQDCLILTVSFPNQSFYWPNVQARTDMQAKNFTEINRDKQESLCRLLDRQCLLLVDHSTITSNESLIETRKQQLSTNISEEDNEFSDYECHFLWSYRYFIIHKPYALSKLLKSRSVWDYPSLIDIYGLIDLIIRHRTIDEIESFELLLPAFPDMNIRSFAYKSLILRITSDDLIIYLPQILQIIKYDYNYSLLLIDYLLKQCVNDHYIAHKLYWYLRQLLLTENIHFIRYYYLFMSLIYVINESFHNELQNEYDLCINLKKIGLEIKNSKLNNKRNFLIEQLKELNNEFFQFNQHSCRLPCQFNFLTNNIDVNSCSIYNSLTSPMKLVFNPIDTLCEKYYSIYKIGDDLRQDQIVLQLLSCMDKIWKANDLDFRLSLFNVVQTQERCGFIEMVTESETLLEIEKSSGTLMGSFSESALYEWLRLHNPNENDFQLAIANLTYSCAGYCVATYILGIGDRHNENIMVKKSGHLFHIDFGKYLGDTQKFGWFNRDRAPFVFTKQMLYAMSDGGTSNNAMHRFSDLCCNAFYTLRQNSSLLLLLLSHLCSSTVPNLNYDAVRFVYERLAPSLNYAASITYFTKLIVDSLSSTWTKWNDLFHTLAQATNSNTSSNQILNGPTSPFIPNTSTIILDEKIKSAQIVKYEKRTQPAKHYLYKVKVERLNSTYHYRTYNEFYELYERLNKQFPLIGLNLKYSPETEDKIIAQRRVSEINDFLGNLFRLTNEIGQSDLVRTFFHMLQRDQQMNDNKEKNKEVLSPRTSSESSANNQSKIRIELKYDEGQLHVMFRYANNLPLKNGNEPRPYCKCYLFPDEHKSTKKKGKIANSRNPFFNDTITYKMDLAEIQKRVLRVSVWNNVLNVRNHVLGEFDIVLSQIDWSKENACDYTFTSV